MTLLKVAILALFFLSSSLYAKEYIVCKEHFFIRENQIKDKQLYLESILKKYPDSVECMLKLSSLYLRGDRVSDGFNLIKEAYEKDPKLVESKKVSKVLDLALRLSQLREFAIRSRSTRFWNELGDRYFKLAIYSEARDAYKESLSIDKDQIRVEILLAICFGKLNLYLDSANTLKSALKKDPYSFYANYYLGKVLKNRLGAKEDGKRYLLMAKYIIDNSIYQFKNSMEKRSIMDDLEFELEE